MTKRDTVHFPGKHCRSKPGGKRTQSEESASLNDYGAQGLSTFRSDQVAVDVPLLPLFSRPVEARPAAAGVRRSGNAKLIAAGLLIGIPLLYLISCFFSGKVADESHDSPPGGVGERRDTPALESSETQFALAIASYATLISSMLAFFRSQHVADDNSMRCTVRIADCASARVA